MENEDLFETDSVLASTHKINVSPQIGSSRETAPLLSSSAFPPEENARSIRDYTHLSRTDNRRANDEGARRIGLNGLPWWRTPSVYWLLPAFAVFTTAFGATIVPKIELILTLVCRRYYSQLAIADPGLHFAPVLEGENNPQCRIPEIQSLVSKFTLYLSLISGILSAIVSPKLGELSDRYGRTRLLALTTLGMLLNEAVFIAVAHCPTLSVYWILLGSVFDGLGGSFIAAMALSYAYATDCTPSDRRNVVFGYYHGVLFAGIALGPTFAGLVVKYTSDLLSIFYVALACHCAFGLFLLLVLPESLNQKRQTIARDKAIIARARSKVDAHSKSANISARIFDLFARVNLLSPLKVLWPTGEGTSPDVRRNLALLAAVDTTMFGVAMGAMTVILIYTNYIFGWATLETSFFVSAVNASRVVVLLIILPLMTRLLRGKQSEDRAQSRGCDQIDLAIIRLAIFMDLVGYVGYATAKSPGPFILAGLVSSFGGMGSPTIQSALTKHVPPDLTGQVLGAMGLLHASARVVAPTIFNLIYASTIGKFDQAVFVCLAATFGLALGFALFIKPHVYWKENIAVESDS